MYNIKSAKAEEFISDSEIRDTMQYAHENRNNRELIKDILEKARSCKGLSHREAAVLLECDQPDLVEQMYDLAREIKKLEQQLIDIDEELFGDAASDYVRAAELTDLKTTTEDRLMQLYAEEEELNEG